MGIELWIHICRHILFWVHDLVFGIELGYKLMKHVY